MPNEASRSSESVWLLPGLMLLGAVLGLLLGTLVGPSWNDPDLQGFVLAVRLCGSVFLSLLKALIIPLIVTSVITGVTRMGDVRRLGRVAVVVFGYFAAVMLSAVIVGLVFVNLISPGFRGRALEPSGIDEALEAVAGHGTAQAIADVITGMFPPNLVEAAAEGNVLGLIVFSLIFGIVLAVEGRRARPLAEMLEIVNEALLRLVRWVIWLAPLGIFGLVADRLGSAGGGEAVWGELRRLGWYALTVVISLLFHGMVTLPLFIRFFARRSPLKFAKGMKEALIMALGTASSAATMAVTMRCAIVANKVKRRAVDLVIPLGTTVNMSGTALYEAVAVIFIAQSMDIQLPLAQQFVVLITATLAAVGAAAIPEAGLVTMVLVLSAVGLPAEGVGLILSIDWVLDRLRTAMNVWDDAVGAAIVERHLPDEAAWSLEEPEPLPTRS